MQWAVLIFTFSAAHYHVLGNDSFRSIGVSNSQTIDFGKSASSVEQSDTTHSPYLLHKQNGSNPPSFSSHNSLQTIFGQKIWPSPPMTSDKPNHPNQNPPKRKLLNGPTWVSSLRRSNPSNNSDVTRRAGKRIKKKYRKVRPPKTIRYSKVKRPYLKHRKEKRPSRIRPMTKYRKTRPRENPYKGRYIKINRPARTHPKRKHPKVKDLARIRPMTKYRKIRPRENRYKGKYSKMKLLARRHPKRKHRKEKSPARKRHTTKYRKMKRPVGKRPKARYSTMKRPAGKGRKITYSMAKRPAIKRPMRTSSKAVRKRQKKKNSVIKCRGGNCWEEILSGAKRPSVDSLSHRRFAVSAIKRRRVRRFKQPIMLKRPKHKEVKLKAVNSVTKRLRMKRTRKQISGEKCATSLNKLNPTGQPIVQINIIKGPAEKGSNVIVNPSTLQVPHEDSNCETECDFTYAPVCITNGHERKTFVNDCEYKKAMGCCPEKFGDWRVYTPGVCFRRSLTVPLTAEACKKTPDQ